MIIIYAKDKIKLKNNQFLIMFKGILLFMLGL